MSLISFGIVLLIAFSAVWRNADPLSPARVFGFVWALAVGLADMKLSMFQHEWSLDAWLVLLLGVAAFLLGVFIFFQAYADTPLLSLPKVRERLKANAASSLDTSRLYWAIIVLFVLYGISYLAEVAIVGNVPLFSPMRERARVSFGVFGLHLFVTAMHSILFLTVEYFAIGPRDRSRRRILGLLAFVTAGSFFLLLQRYSFFIVAVMSLAFLQYASRFLRPRNLLLTAAAFVGMLLSIQSLRTAQYIEAYVYWVSRMRIPRQYAIFAEPYMYVTMNLENFARGVDKLQQFYYGIFTFDWLWAITGLKHWMEEYFHLVQLPFLNSGYNTFTFHWWYYYDFGVLGVAVLPFITGCATAYWYYQLRTSPKVVDAFLYATCVLLMAISYTMNPLYRLDFISNIALIWALHVFVFPKKREEEPKDHV